MAGVRRTATAAHRHGRRSSAWAKGRQYARRALPLALVACSSVLALRAVAAEVRGGSAFCAFPRGAPGPRDGLAPAIRSVVRRQSAATFSGTAFGSPSDFPGFVPDPALHGKLRSLARLLLIAGEKLVEASTARASWLNNTHGFSDKVLHVSGTALRRAAEAILKEQWDHADHFLSVARSQVNPLLPQGQLAAIQGMLSGTSALVETGAALSDLGRTLEKQAEKVSESCGGCLDDVCAPLQDAFFDAAGALSAAARLFADKARAAPPRASAAPRVQGPETYLQQVDQALAEAQTPRERQAALRQLAKRFHPDRNPGREAQVLAAFRHVQSIRSEERWSSLWGA